MAKIKVRRGNEVLHVDETLADYYVNKGFDVIGEGGTIVRAAIPHDLGSLQVAYIENNKTIEMLKAQIVELTEKLNAKKSTVKTKKVESED